MPRSQAEQLCSSQSACVGVALPANSTTGRLLDYMDLDTWRPLSETFTLVRTRPEETDGLVATSAWDLDDLDLCCPENREVEEVREEVVDTLERVSCDMDSKEFLARFVTPKEPVVLVGCTEGWPAAGAGAISWTMESLLERKGEWRTDWIERRAGGLLEAWAAKDFLPGWRVSQILARNGTARVFHALARRSRGGEEPLFQDYTTPGPLPKDLYQAAGLGTDYQWLILSQAGTGTALHHDPAFTIAWNSLVSGTKWWALLPAHLPADPFTCRPACSATREGEVSQAAWFHHVLPQLRRLSWYGQGVRQVVLGPGETLYLPTNMAHAVYNLEDNVSVTENYLASEGVAEVVAALVTGEDAGLGLGRGEERLWRSLYYGQLDREGRRRAREVVARVEGELERRPHLCHQTD